MKVRPRHAEHDHGLVGQRDLPLSRERDVGVGDGNEVIQSLQFRRELGAQPGVGFEAEDVEDGFHG